MLFEVVFDQQNALAVASVVCDINDLLWQMPPELLAFLPAGSLLDSGGCYVPSGYLHSC